MFRSTCVAVLAAAITLTSSLSAQEVGPQAGTWGAEAGADNRVNVLRFRSPTSAWLLGFDAFHFRLSEEGSEDESSSSVTVRLGIRGYGNPTERVRPISGVSILLGYQDIGLGDGPLVGASGELGAAYFFSRHVSLGSAFDLSVSYVRTEGPGFGTGAPLELSRLAAQASIRFIGAVYF